jgi:hypothetical protein
MTFPAPTRPNSVSPADVGPENAGLDTSYLANLLQRDANASDVIDQAHRPVARRRQRR